MSFEVMFAAEMLAVAKNLALQGSYGNPFYIQQTGPLLLSMLHSFLILLTNLGVLAHSHAYPVRQNTAN